MSAENISQPGPLQLFVIGDADRSGLLRDWARTAGHALHEVPSWDDPGLRRQWNRLAQRAESGFLVDYPIETPTDVRTAAEFIAAATSAGGAWYYAPRPNDHVAVGNAALVGMIPALPRARAPLLQRLPAMMRPVLKRLPRRFLKLARRFVERRRQGGEPGPGTVVGSRVPQVETPASLSRWHTGWQPWRPGQAVLERDLVERVERFFPFPQAMHVILLNKCNLKCVMCPYHSPVYREEHTSGYFDEYRAMKPETLDRVAEYAARHRIGIQFGQIEEALMHKQAIRFITRAKDLGVPRVHLTTNGTLLNAEKAEALAASGIDSVMFSIDAATEETYRKVRGEDLAKVEANMRYFIPLAKARGINIMASFILQPQAVAERETFLAKWRDVGVDQVTFYVLTEHDPKTGTPLRGDDMYDQGKRYPCASPWLQTVIFPDGETSLCCKTMTEVGWRGVVSVGNVDAAGVDAVWSGPDYRQVRAELLRNRFERFDVCTDCSIWSASTYLTEYGNGYVRTYNETMETYTFR